MASSVLVVHGPDERAHQVPVGHPESVDRIDAVQRGIEVVEARSSLEVIVGRHAEPGELELVHTPDHIRSIRRLSEHGGGAVDPDTYASAGTFDAACGAAGAGLVAAERLLAADDHMAAFVVARPPGHHAGVSSAKGFCFFNNVAVTAAHLVAAGNRVAIIDWDAHHGDGTQEIFWSDDRVHYVSTHQEALYPGSGLAHERGPGPARLTTLNLPLPAGATGDRYLALFDDPVAPEVTRFAPDWVLVSCGFDAHRDDPLAGMALVADDFALLTERVLGLAPRSGRLILFLEGGYDLTALETCTTAVVATLAGVSSAPAAPSTGGAGAARVRELRRLWA